MRARLLTPVLLALLAAGCGTSDHHASASSPTTVAVKTTSTIPRYLRERMRPIGNGVRFHPPLTGQPTGGCLRDFNPRDEAHIELFGANKVVLLPAGIGTRGPRKLIDGELTGAACFGSVVTLNDTGILYLRPGAEVTLQTLFEAWGKPLSEHRIASFTGGHAVRTYVNGKRFNGDPRRLRITPHAEIVIEIGPRVPPHTSFAYPPIPRVSS